MERVRASVLRAAIAASIVTAVLAPLAVHWLAGRTLVWFDTQRLFAPQRWMVDEALRAFRLPLWNPFLGAGMPFLADTIHGVLHPVSVVTAWLGTTRSEDVLVGGYVACAGLGAAVLARDLGASRAGAAATAFVFATSGFVLSVIGYLNLLAGAASLPFCIAGLRRFAVDPRPASLAFGAGGTAVLALSGDPEALMIGGFLALALAWEAGGWRGALRAAAAGTAGLLVAGVQLVPSAAHIARTERAADTWSRSPMVWSFEPWRIPELVLPGLLRGPDPLLDPVFEGLAGPARWPEGGLPVPFAQSVCVGLLPMALAFAGIRAGRRGKLLAILAAVLLWIALGPALGADAVAAQVPIWGAFRYSEKLAGALTLVVSILAGLGLDAVVERRVAGWHVLVAAGALGLASVAGFRLAVARLPPDVAAIADARILRGAWHVLASGLALGGWMLARGRLGASRGPIALAVLVWCGMTAASPAALRPGDPDSRLRSPGPDVEASAPGPRIVTPFLYDPLSTDPGLDWMDQAGRSHARLGYAAYNVRARLDSLDFYGGMRPRRLALLGAVFDVRWPVAARRYAATHLVTAPPLTSPQKLRYAVATNGAARIEGASGAEIWTAPHRQWASFPPELRTAGDERAALLETARTFAEQSEAVVVETRSDLRAGPGRVLSIRRGLESVRVEAEAEAESTLVVADAWWPGWEATLDGLRVPIFPADVLVRAVRWPAGRHVLEMRYRPPELRLGLAASALGAAACVAWSFLLRRERAPAVQQGGR